MRILFTFFIILLASACSHRPATPIPMAENVELDRFMGRWYVVANIPTFIEKGAHNAIETYRMNKDGSIDTEFRFNQDSFDGDLEVYNPTGFVSETNNSLWGMQFIWPIKAEYIIAYLDDDYQNTIIARNARDYVWIMSRSPDPGQETIDKLINFSVEMGYPRDQIKRVPHEGVKP